MPQIDLINVPLYGPNDPYHYEFDNLPLKALMQREDLLNLALDNVIREVSAAVGTQGSIANRLAQSINPDGTLMASAVDSVLHGIGSHADDGTYVRMLRAESDKLALVADEATDFGVEVQLDDAGTSVQGFDDGVVRLAPSSTVTWTLTAPNRIKANINFPLEAAHKHYYDEAPVHANLGSPDFFNYKANSLSTAFNLGSLRVFVNGTRLSRADAVYVPGALVTDPETLLSFTEDAAAGTFALSSPLSPADIIRIDYDTTFA